MSFGEWGGKKIRPREKSRGRSRRNKLVGGRDSNPHPPGNSLALYLAELPTQTVDHLHQEVGSRWEGISHGSLGEEEVGLI